MYKKGINKIRKQTRGLEALTRMLFFTFAIIIIGLFATIEATKRN